MECLPWTQDCNLCLQFRNRSSVGSNAEAIGSCATDMDSYTGTVHPCQDAKYSCDGVTRRNISTRSLPSWWLLPSIIRWTIYEWSEVVIVITRPLKRIVWKRGAPSQWRWVSPAILRSREDFTGGKTKKLQELTTGTTRERTVHAWNCMNYKWNFKKKWEIKPNQSSKQTNTWKWIKEAPGD